MPFKDKIMARKNALHNDRLACFYENKEHSWDEHWAEIITPDLYKEEEKPYFGEFSFLKEHSPPLGKILEAGCGTGIYVWKLSQLGFDCEGIDTAAAAIDQVHRIKPMLPIEIGDVLNISKPDSYYAGIISLGVIEHREDGPEPFIAEMSRVLMNNGVAIITFPYFNKLRKIKSFLGLYSKKLNTNDIFYQYYLSEDEVSSIANKYGFKIIMKYYYDVPFCFKLEIANKENAIYKFLRRLLLKICKELPIIKPSFSHCCALICKKQT